MAPGLLVCRPEHLVATASNLPARWPVEIRTGATVSLESLPLRAALVDANGHLREANSEWRAAFPTPRPGESGAPWCDGMHLSTRERGALLAGLAEVLSGACRRFVHEYSTARGYRSVSISPCGADALILEQAAGPSEEAVPGNPDGEQDRQAQRMEAMGRLVGGVAHDFANVLTLINGYSEILLNRIGGKDPLRSELEEIRSAASRGARMTAQLLGFTRGQTAERRPLDLNALIGDMERMLRPILGEHIELETALSPDLGKVVADAGQMEQVILNLILNARDAMPSGGYIRVETANADLDAAEAAARGATPGPSVMLTISDTGHGIDAESIERVFEPFFTTKEHGKGTGLGLSTVHTVVKQSGGQVWVRSTVGQGATFMICLPRARSEAEGGGNAAASRPAPSGTETVLLVEDEEPVRRLLTHILRRRGYRVLEASGGQDALRIFGEHASEIDLVVTDMVMPHMMGRELAARLEQQRPGIRIVYMSGYPDDVLFRTGALSPGMTLLRKPLRPDALAAKIREALDSPSRPFNPR